VTVERPLRSNFCHLGGRPVERKIMRPSHQPVWRHDDSSSVEVSSGSPRSTARRAPLFGLELRLRCHHLDLGAERDGVLGEHGADRLKLTSATNPPQRSYHSPTERRSSSASSRFIVVLGAEHDPEKWEPVSG